MYPDFFEKGGWPKWLNTKNRRGGWLTYEEAIKFVHGLGLMSLKEWLAYCKGNRTDLPPKPANIPASPSDAYSDFSARGGWGAWIGTGRKHLGAIKWRSYDDAVKFVHSLKLKNRDEWLAYCRGHRPDLRPKPTDIPSYPIDVYREIYLENSGASGWLGSKKSEYRWRSYSEAVKFSRSLGLKNREEWSAYCQGKHFSLPRKPSDIPSSPREAYREEWIGWSNWIGTDRRYRTKLKK